MILARPGAIRRIARSFRVHPAVALLGPRQCGKTTLARLVAAREPVSTFFDLERDPDLRRLENPEQTLGPLGGLVVVDETQHLPPLFRALRPIIDQAAGRTRFLLLGSVSPTIVKGVSESLAGRIGLVDLAGFDLGEIGPEADWRILWERGGFPRSYLQPDAPASWEWRENFIRTFLERDLSATGENVPAAALRRFWSMTAHYHGQIWNAAEFARALGRGETLAKRYLDLLVGAFVVRALPPWFENLKKRQVRSPKVFVRDTGLLHALLGIPSLAALTGHPKVGASFEGFAIEQVCTALSVRDPCFWATHAGAELDLLVTRNGKRYGFEIKFSEAPRTTRSMRVAISDLGLERLFVVYPGEEAFALDSRIEAFPVGEIPKLAERPEFVTG